MIKIMKKKISVIVPIYNSEKYLRRCFDSIFNQSFKDFELVLVDDGSTDSSIEICEEYSNKHNNIKLIKSKHISAGACRNIGINNSKSEYIAFIDSDDYIDSLYLETLYNESIINDYDLCFCDYLLTSKNSINKSYKNIKAKSMTQNEMYGLFFRTKGEKGYYACWGKLFKKDLLKDFVFVEDKINEDILFFYEVIKKGKRFGYIKEPLYYYFNNPDSITNRTFNKEKLALLTMWDCVLKDTETNNKDYLDKCNNNIMRSRFTLLAKMHIDGYDKKDSELIETKKEFKSYVRKHYFQLLKINMPLNRKVLLTLLII